jgi:hypothetical protein
MGVPLRYRFGSGYTLQVLTGYACCGLFAAIPHADTHVHTHYVPALGMRRACVSMVRTTHRSDSVARSTPTAQQERSKKSSCVTSVM